MFDLATSPSVAEALSFLCNKPDLKPNDEFFAGDLCEDPDEALLCQLAALDRSLGPNRACNQNRKERRACFKATKLKRPDRSRKEATASDQKKYVKDFLEAKLKEYKSWVDNDVFELVDLRKVTCKNFVRGRWVLTIKRDKDGNFLKCKARWVLRGLQDRQAEVPQVDSPTATRPAFRSTCQVAANREWDLCHIDLKTAFLQGEKFNSERDIIAQCPPEAGQPWYMGARLLRSAYGLKDAPRLWWNKLDKTFRELGMTPVRADRCCYVLYGDQQAPQPSGSNHKTKDFLQAPQPSSEHPEVQHHGAGLGRLKKFETGDSNLDQAMDPVSYTHLRAHETREDGVWPRGL